MIKAICFDLDGVYFTPDGKKKFHNSLVEMGIPEDKVINALYKSSELLSFVKGEISEDAFWDYMRKYLEVDMTNEDWLELWIEGYVVDQSVREMVLKVKDAGYRTCVCSNNNKSRIRGLQHKFGFLHDFDVKIFSYEVGQVKPNDKIFQALIDQSGVQPEEIVYSDDNAERIEGARNLEINVFVYENFMQFVEELRSLNIKL